MSSAVTWCAQELRISAIPSPPSSVILGTRPPIMGKQWVWRPPVRNNSGLLIWSLFLLLRSPGFSSMDCAPSCFLRPGRGCEQGRVCPGQTPTPWGRVHPHPRARSSKQQINKYKCAQPHSSSPPGKGVPARAVPLGTEYSWPRLAPVSAELSECPEPPAASWLLGTMAPAPSPLTLVGCCPGD